MEMLFILGAVSILQLGFLVYFIRKLMKTNKQYPKSRALSTTQKSKTLNLLKIHQSKKPSKHQESLLQRLEEIKSQGIFEYNLNEFNLSPEKEIETKVIENKEVFAPAAKEQRRA